MSSRGSPDYSLSRISKKQNKAEEMQMNRRDIKPGNGASLLSYQNHESLKRNLKNMKSLVSDRASDFYLGHYEDRPYKFAHNWDNYQNKLNTENSRFFKRLVSIAEVSFTDRN